MHIYISLAHIALALAFGGGFFVGRVFFTSGNKKAIEAAANKHWRNHYRAQYNEQMGELCSRYRQERSTLLNQFESLTSELEREIEWLKAGCDPDKTKEEFSLRDLSELDKGFAEVEGAV